MPRQPYALTALIIKMMVRDEINVLVISINNCGGDNISDNYV